MVFLAVWFTAPWMVAGVLAAGIPIALHFFYRSRYRTIPWAAMEFLLTSIEQTSRRLKFQELLLLLLRVLLFVLLALALARPDPEALFGGASASRGDAVDAIFVIDTSYSMAARDGALPRTDPHNDPYLLALNKLAAPDGTLTRLVRAKAAALAVLDHLPPHSTVQVIAASDRALLLGPRTSTDREQARQLIEELEMDHLATDFLPGFTEAFAVLGRGNSPNKEVYLFSDQQASGWDQQSGALTEKAKEIAAKGTLYLVQCGSQVPLNVAVETITPQSGIPHTGERMGFTVRVRNTSDKPASNLNVSLSVDGQELKETQPIRDLGPGETRAVTLSARMQRAGLRVITATVKHDELDADNRLDQVIRVRDRVRILIVDGSPSEKVPEEAGSFFLEHALLPVPDGVKAQYHVQPRRVPASQASPALLADKDLCILVNVPLQAEPRRRSEVLPPEFVEHLTEFVRNGHGLIIFGGDHVSVDAYNRILHEQHDLLPFKLAGIRTLPADSELLLDRNSVTVPAYWKFREDDYYKTLNEVRTERILDVEETVQQPAGESGKPGPESGQVLLRYSNGRPAVAARRIAAGEVILVTTSADRSWTDWPLHLGMYVSFVDSTVSHLLHQLTQSHNFTAGEPLRWYPPETDATRPFLLVQPSGRKLRLGAPEIVQGRPVVTTADTPRAGIYRIIPADALGEGSESETSPVEETFGVPFAVSPDLRESDNLEGRSEPQSQQMGIKAIHLKAGDDPNVFAGGERRNRDWMTLGLLWTVLVIALAEALLAWFCGRAW